MLYQYLRKQLLYWDDKWNKRNYINGTVVRTWKLTSISIITKILCEMGKLRQKRGKEIKTIWARFLEAQITYIVFVEDIQAKEGIVSEPVQFLAQYSFLSLRYSRKPSTPAKTWNLYITHPTLYLRGHIHKGLYCLYKPQYLPRNRFCGPTLVILKRLLHRRWFELLWVVAI